ncbi:MULTISPECIES: type IV toxin-antitoxin system AbiEi family antitoxin domain-containing protein [Loigolactobacillus]|uniref:type IV toxin-antitoxin system AbiEi family antitoxin domain-containing protein n=1 Tax=Loigolactobacillus TaxID=2767889 RepID=UPI0007F09469|nr:MULTISPECIES: type IV toxin-antitoxin system AbiEi family antitoxin domain-containing protein [Loigolactobacillus]ANK59127.1 hypothetical protein AYR52_01905 [Loigolactobacillus backii]ANK64116.1 hypothetical protein AYR54_01895 [Loigolactobacillus backii]ANK67490.1 hypothetical protein AYR55_07145 [Loigolactobacillus backii]MDA5387342.1 type IV toxin-antitoxin system AbiEi family antitoxin domain-containing protein [Loigolactobacillus backii]MDA5389881.1 type IV toxin-antitoxin system AbiE
MVLTDQAQLLLTKYNGIFTAKQALLEGIVSSILSRMVKQGLIERVGPGVYIDPTSFEDEFALAQLRFTKGIFCRETALHLYDLTDKTPNFLEMTFPRGYNSPHFEELRIRPYWQIETLRRLGVTTVKTEYGNRVAVYGIERTLCDIIRSPHIAQDEIIRNAMQAYVKRSDRNLIQLMHFAKLLKVEEKMRTYMGVLL